LVSLLLTLVLAIAADVAFGTPWYPS